MDPAYATVADTTTDASGRFILSPAKPVEDGYLAVQPSARRQVDGIGVYEVEPRLYRYAGQTELELRLPLAACVVVRAHDPNGNLMRWAQFRSAGEFAGQFLYATDLADRSVPAVCWPVFDGAARAAGQPREWGLPTILVPPGSNIALHALFWETARYGKLHLRADREGKGFAARAPRDALIVDLNVELARTAVHDLERRQFSAAARPLRERLRETLALDSPAERAKAADTILAEALRLRDELELEAAWKRIPELRQGALDVHVRGRNGDPAGAGCKISCKQISSDFLFGIFEGGRLEQSLFERVRGAGFNLATALLAWNWTGGFDGPLPAKQLEEAYGIRAMRELGFTLKAHGVVWLQGYGILPPDAASLSFGALRDALLAHQRSLIESLKDQIHIWEAANEPNLTNTAGASAADIRALVVEAAKNIKQVPGLTSLVNSGHEGDYGARFAVYNLDGEPDRPWVSTYSGFLDEPGILDNIDFIGLQYYPGHRFNERFGGLEGPCTTPAWLIDTLDRYARFNRPLHVTEFSVPGVYGDDWRSGYWRRLWDRETQADYAERVFTLAFAHPDVQSITWWDVTDRDSSVVQGGLFDAAGHPKPVFERLAGLLHGWTQSETHAATDASGRATLHAFAGEYRVEAATPSGTVLTRTVRIPARTTTTVDLIAE
jgi:hypothetical protein